MFIKDWKKEVFTIPNFLSLFRLILIPVSAYVYLHATETKEFVIAGVILMLSCLTDMIDGKIARKYHMISRLGILLDPVADKATQFAIILCLSFKYPVLYPVLFLLVIKESFQLIAGIIAYVNGQMLSGALFIGKFCTTVLFVSIIVLVWFPEIPQETVKWIAAVDACFLLMSFVQYIYAYYGKNKKIRDLDEEL